MKIKNVVGTADEVCPSESWLEYWEEGSGKTAGACGALDCNSNADVGAHVRKVDANDFTIYIYPLCSGCNQRTGAFAAWEGYTPVPAP